MAPNPIDLYKVLDEGRVFCPAVLGGGEYLPRSVLDKYVKEPNITDCCLVEGVPKELFQTISKSARKVFVILLLTDKVEIVRDMLGCGIQDEDLPLSLDEGRDYLVSRSGKHFQPLNSPWPGKFRRDVKTFLDKQWVVQPPVLDDSGGHHSVDPKCALPFLETLQSLGTAAVFDCTIHTDYFCNVDDTAQPLRDSDGDAVTEGQTCGRRVAVKKFTERADFIREITALRAAREANQTHLIRFLSTCEKSNTYYILLPWAEGSTLHNFWVNNGPKTMVRNRTLVRKSIDQLLQLSAALQFLHSMKFRHGDLKPDNILHFTDPSGQDDNFVIADLGISSHHHLATGHWSRTPTNMKSTTLAYEAPEVVTARHLPRSRKYDVWSMGCIILEYIVWLLWDTEAVDAFADAREYPAFAFYLAQSGGDGAKTAIVRPEVVTAIDGLRADPRGAAGTALCDLFDLVERGLLVVDVDQRWDAEQLHAALDEIARKASATGGGASDAYVLPPDATAPVIRPAIFRRSGPQSGAGARGTAQPSLSASRIGTRSMSTTTTIAPTPLRCFSPTWTDSLESLKNAGRSRTSHAGAAAASDAFAALAAGAPKKASTWTVLVRAVSGASGDRDRDRRGVVAAWLSGYYAPRKEKVHAKLRLWRERRTLSHAEKGIAAS